MNSMYPSAMMRIGQEGGYPTGPAAMIPPHMLNVTPLPYRHYIVRIRISRIGKHQQIPFVSVRDRTSGSIRRFNRGDTPDCTFFVDKITLEDWIEFCQIEYTVTEGLYWNQSGVTECAKTIQDLKHLRDRYKLEGNDLQQNVKLIMNMGYGTLVIKKVSESIIIKEQGQEAMQYVSERFGIFKSWERFGRHVQIKMAKYDCDF